MSQNEGYINLYKIGIVKNDFEGGIPEDYKEKISIIEINDEYEEALLEIEKHSHITVLCWFNRSDRSVLRVHPMADESNPLTGVFATRSPVRPNPIAVTVCELVKREGNKLFVKGLDALNETPVIDIKSHKDFNLEDLEYPDWIPR